jgi:hypothetical protein
MSQPPDPSALITNLFKLVSPELAVAEASDAAVTRQATAWAALSQVERDHTVAQLLYGQLVVSTGIIRVLGDIEKRLEGIQAGQGVAVEVIEKELGAVRAVLDRPFVVVPPTGGG